jgi:type IV pilus assembly protein PilA
MMKRIHEMRDEKGFTLIELMVVVLIIAILIAIAIPTFLGLRSRAQNRSAQSDLRNALTAAKAFYTDADTFTGFNAAEGEELEPALDWNTTGGAPATGEVSIREVASKSVYIQTQSESGVFFGMGEDTAQQTKYCQGAAVATIAACTGTDTSAWA